MAYATFDLKSKKVKNIKTKYRTICTPIPHPKSIPLIKKMNLVEPRSMGGQPPIVWHRAKDFTVYDEYGNKWIDFSSGVLVANCGHLRDEVKEDLLDQINQGLIHNYCFPNKPRAELVKELISIAPKGFEKAFLLTTGAESVENALKLARTYGIKIGGKKKIGIISFINAFHGRTLGAQMAGGIPALKEWIVNIDPSFIQVPFPDGVLHKDISFDGFLAELKKQKVTPDSVAAVIMEPYQGGTACFADKKYVQQLRTWCTKNKVLFISDEVQAGFCRTGKMFSIQHYDITPDIICCGKGISGGLPISAVLGKKKFMDLYGPGEMTSTHTGNPLVCRTALRSINLLKKEKLAERSARLGKILHSEFTRIWEKYPKVIGAVNGKGLLLGVLIRKYVSMKRNNLLALSIVEKCIQKGLMLYAPLGPGGATIKMNPPLIIAEEALREGIAVFEEALEEALEKK